MRHAGPTVYGYTYSKKVNDMVNWLKPKYSAIGMDLGRTAIRAVQLRRRDHRLQIYSAWELKNNGLCDPGWGSYSEPIFDETQVISQIKRLRESGGFIGRDVVIHCPAEKLDMRPVDLPAGKEGLPRDAVLGALRLQMGGHLPFPMEQAVFDYLPRPNGDRPGSIRIMAITADGQWIKERIHWIESAGMHCIGVDALPCVMSRLSTFSGGSEGFFEAPASSAPDPQESTDSKCLLRAVLDIGYSGSTLTAHDSQGPLFCRRFALGGREMSEILAQRLTVDFGRAEQFKRRFGIDCNSRRLCLAGAVADTREERAEGNGQGEETYYQPSDPSPEQDQEIGKTIFAALQSELRAYVEGLTRSLNYVITNYPGARLQKIYLTGAGAHTRNLDRYLTDQFELPVQVLGHRLLSELTDSLPATRAQGGNWTTALGLSLHQMEEV